MNAKPHPWIKIWPQVIIKKSHSNSFKIIINVIKHNFNGQHNSYVFKENTRDY